MPHDQLARTATLAGKLVIEADRRPLSLITTLSGSFYARYVCTARVMVSFGRLHCLTHDANATIL